MTQSIQWIMNSPVGSLHLVASEAGLQGVFWKRQSQGLAKSLTGSPAHEHLALALRQLEEYFEGRRTRFELGLDVQGTPFQKRVWSELSRIPYGKTRSYAEIARSLKQDKAFRAVGTANGRNPISIIVPCHRVIASDGTLGGYAGGLDAKARLLGLERRERE
jgi:methylated-DNA-[protein]-cysteine S-methyltransferase